VVEPRRCSSTVSPCHPATPPMRPVMPRGSRTVSWDPWTGAPNPPAPASPAPPVMPWPWRQPLLSSSTLGRDYIRVNSPSFSQGFIYISMFSLFSGLICKLYFY
jgi:hypothetical protein